ncbi:LLM class flavin-dependent oxidoreductase [Rhodococcus sp. NPDC127530]|uniref:LLM class flavin-dependent oxidoreductase n=1 Tax=Rhodococcus sp. NPDC127530 TaxID=3345397 RepID=UPI00363B3197
MPRPHQPHRAARFRRLEESLLLIRSLFTGAPTTFQGEFVSVDGLTLYPKPVQTGGPPVGLGARRPGAIRRAARYADVWLPHMTPRESCCGRDSMRFPYARYTGALPPHHCRKDRAGEVAP